jgi:SAM-dependent methyltransferase
MSACVVCGSSDLALHLTVGAAGGSTSLHPTTTEFGSALSDIVRCRSCGHMQLDRFPSDDELDSAYAGAESEDYIEEEEGQRATARVALERIERAAPERGRLLDVGCWVGFLLAEARARGWETVGIEPSEFARGHARGVLGLDVLDADLFTADLPSGAFDAVVLGDVLEHLVRPGDGLDRIAALLRPGGVLYIAVPDAGSRLARRMGARWWSVIPTHVQYFTRSSLSGLLGAHGYEVLWMGTAPKSFTVGYYLSRLGGYSEAVGSAVTGGAARLGLADRLWTPDFRDRLGVLARRTA